MSTATAAAGNYVLKLTAEGADIVDEAGNSLTSDSTLTWRTNPWHNFVEPFNVDGRPGIAPVDVVLVINETNGHSVSDMRDGQLLSLSGIAPAPPYVDVNDDGYVTAIDALLVIDFINWLSPSAAEGELSLEPLSDPLTHAAAVDRRSSDGGVKSQTWPGNETPELTAKAAEPLAGELLQAQVEFGVSVIDGLSLGRRDR